MRLQILSDLHLELGAGPPAEVAAERGLRIPDTDADVVVLAGDIAAGADGVIWAAQQWPDRDVLYVLGNHEFYHQEVEGVIAACREAAAGTRVHVLERDGITLHGVRFLGTTLWTDFALFGNVRAGELAAARVMMDFRLIHHPRTGILEPATTRDWHADNLAWLNAEMAATDEPVVVVSHHAPHRRSDHFGTTASAGFVSHLEPLIYRHAPSLWIHGHTHGDDDYRVGPTRIVSNQLGYRDEDTRFNPGFCVEVDDDPVMMREARS